MNNKNKKFDAVKMMREIRNRLARKYRQQPEERMKRLKMIREKYGIKESTKTV